MKFIPRARALQEIDKRFVNDPSTKELVMRKINMVFDGFIDNTVYMVSKPDEMINKNDCVVIVRMCDGDVLICFTPHIRSKSPEYCEAKDVAI